MSSSNKTSRPYIAFMLRSSYICIMKIAYILHRLTPTSVAVRRLVYYTRRSSRSLPDLIATRGRYGICYLAWGIPQSRLAKGETALRSLEKILVSRIKNFLNSPAYIRKAYFEPPVPQSTLVSDFSTLAHRDQLQTEKRLLSAKEAENTRVNSRLIL